MWAAVYPHCHQNKVIFRVGNNRSLSILTGLLRHVNTLVTISIPLFLQHLPHFTTHALVYGPCASVSAACVASLLPPLAISSRSRLPVLSMWTRSSVAIKLWCRRAKNNVRQHKRVFISLDGMVFFAGKEPEHRNYLPTSLPRGVDVSGLLRIRWLSYEQEYSQICNACQHLLTQA